MLALLPLLVAAQGQTVSFTCRAEPMSRLVADLSKATGLNLSTTKDCAPDVLVICVNGVSTNALLNEIAKVDAGEWKPDSGGYVFQPDVAARRQEARAERAARAQNIRTQIAKAIVNVAKQEAEQKAQEAKAMAEARAKAEAQAKAAGAGADDIPDFDSPSMNLEVSSTRVLQLLQTLDPEDLVLDPGRRVVYSSRPNQMQYGMGGDGEQFLAQIVQEHNDQIAKYEQQQQDAEAKAAAEAAAADKGKDDNGGGDDGAGTETGGSDDAGQPATDAIQNDAFGGGMMSRIDSFSKADLSVEQSGVYGMYASIETTLTIYDAKGNVILEASASVPLNSGDVMANTREIATITETSPDPPPSESGASGAVFLNGGGETVIVKQVVPQPQKPGSGTPIELSDDSKVIAALASDMGDPAQMGKRMKVVADLMADPAHRDPLGFVVSDALISLAKLRHKPLVAVVPDDAEETWMYSMGAVGTVEQFESGLKAGTPMVENATGAWIEVKPTGPEFAREFRVDRAVLAKFVKATRANGGGTLDDIAALAQSAPSPEENAITRGYVGMYGSGTTRFSNGDLGWDLLRVFGGLSHDERQSLAGGAKLPLPLLGMAEQNSVVRMVFGPNSNLKVGKMPDTAPAGPFEFGFFGQTNDSAPGYISEPTEVLPNGVPSGGWLEMTAEELPCFSAGSGEDAGPFSMNLGVDELASMKAISDAQPRANGFTSMFEKIRVGSRTAYHFVFHLANGVRLVAQLNDDRVPKDGQVYTLSDLPEDIQARIQKRVDELKKMMSGSDGVEIFGGGANGGGSPPP